MSGAELRKIVATAIFDPGATEGYKGDRTLTEWQTDAVMRVLAASAPMKIEVCKGQAGLALYVDDTRVAGPRHNGLMETVLSAVIDSPAPVCRSCKGTGTEADYVGHEMMPVEVECSACNGKGFPDPAEAERPEYWKRQLKHGIQYAVKQLHFNDKGSALRWVCDYHPQELEHAISGWSDHAPLFSANIWGELPEALPAQPAPAVGVSNCPISPDSSVAKQIEYARFLAAGQDDPHSQTIDELCDTIELLRKALAPFALQALAGFEQALWSEYQDDQPASLTVKLGDIRRARSALSKGAS